MKKPLVIYHGMCMDGIAAAWCFWKHWKDAMDYHPGVYGQNPPDVTGRVVYLVDFSYPAKTIIAMSRVAERIVILDHHDTLLRDLNEIGRETVNVFTDDCTKLYSGCLIAWKYTQNLVVRADPLPLVMAHIQDYDLWLHALNDTKEVVAGIKSYPQSIEAYDKLMDLDLVGVTMLKERGKILVDQFEADMGAILSMTKREMMIGDDIVPVCNANGHYASYLGNLLCEGVPFAATYYDTALGRVFSLRSSPEGKDVSKIARLYGGGGHVHAAGFKVLRTHTLAKL